MGRLLLLLLSLICFLYSYELKVYFIDVGEGESIFVRTPSDEKILIDTGNLITGYRVYKFLKDMGINSIDLLIVTHPHPDHMGGVFLLLQMLDVKRWCDNGQPIGGYIREDIYRWYVDLFRKGNYCVLKRGDKLKLGDVKIFVLNPENYKGNWNENSMVLKLVYKEVSFLLMGDATKITEKKLLASYGDALRSDVLKVGHHGAEDTTLREFLETVSPEYAVISINKNNIRGYPSERVLKMIRDMGIELLTTYEKGTIEIETDGKDIKVGYFSR